MMKDFIPEKDFLKASEWHLDADTHTDRLCCLPCLSLFTCVNKQYGMLLCAFCKQQSGPWRCVVQNKELLDLVLGAHQRQPQRGKEVEELSC